VVVTSTGCERPAQPANDTAFAAAKQPAAALSIEPANEKTDPIKELNDRLESMGAKVVAEPAEGGSESGAKDYESLAAEVSELRAEVKRLQETIDLTISYVVGDLHEENRRLREEVARVYGAGPEGSEAERDIVYLNPESTGTLGEADLDVSMEIDSADFGEKGYTVIKEWGRAPDEVAALGKNVPSLKGMICVVPAKLEDAQLSEIGRALRAEFEAYDNIVIEVFDNEIAAQAYAEKNLRSTQYNVLSIQKDGATGRDHILLHRNGVSINVPT
jgi:hypothetical protein